MQPTNSNLGSGYHSGSKKPPTKKRRNPELLAVERALGEARAEVGELQKKCYEFACSGWDERSAIVLNTLSHFYSRVLNFPCACKEDRKRLDKIVEEAQHVMKAKLNGDQSGNQEPR